MRHAVQAHPQAAGIVDRSRRALQAPGDEQRQRDRGKCHEEKPSSMPVILTDRPEPRMNMRIGVWRIRAS